jgi:DNA invertase Pin-like site-specific DNA recombinase
MKCYIYARISPTKKKSAVNLNTNEEIAYSINNQLEKCRLQAIKDSAIIIREYFDEYISGKAQEYMKGFLKMIEDSKVELNSGDKIYVYRVDRLGRNTREMLNTIHLFRERKISIYFVAFGFETCPIESNPLSKAMNDVMMVFLSAFAEYQREEIVTRTRIGREIAYKNNPEKFGRPKVNIDWKKVKVLMEAKDTDGKSQYSWTKIAKDINISVSSLIRRYRKEFGELPKRRI